MFNIDEFKTFLHPYFASEASKRFWVFKVIISYIMGCVMCWQNAFFKLCCNLSDRTQLLKKIIKQGNKDYSISE